MGEHSRFGEYVFSLFAGMHEGAKVTFWLASSYFVIQLGRLIAGVVNGSIMVVL